MRLTNGIGLIEMHADCPRCKMLVKALGQEVDLGCWAVNCETCGHSLFNLYSEEAAERINIETFVGEVMYGTIRS